MNTNTENKLRKAAEYAKQRLELLGPECNNRTAQTLTWLTPEMAALREKAMAILGRGDEDNSVPAYEAERPPAELKSHIVDFAQFITQNPQLVTDATGNNKTVIESLIELLGMYYDKEQPDIT